LGFGFFFFFGCCGPPEAPTSAPTSLAAHAGQKTNAHVSQLAWRANTTGFAMAHLLLFFASCFSTFSVSCFFFHCSSTANSNGCGEYVFEKRALIL
jgi:hypothetical protein